MSDAVLDEIERIITDAEITKEDDGGSEPDRAGRQELEVISNGEHISFTCAKIGSLLDVQESKDPEGLRCFYYLVQDLKSRVFSLISLHFKTAHSLSISAQIEVVLQLDRGRVGLFSGNGERSSRAATAVHVLARPHVNAHSSKATRHSRRRQKPVRPPHKTASSRASRSSNASASRATPAVAPLVLRKL